MQGFIVFFEMESVFLSFFREHQVATSTGSYLNYSDYSHEKRNGTQELIMSANAANILS